MALKTFVASLLYNGTEMRSIRKILESIVTAKPKISVDNVNTSGDVVFRVSVRSLGLDKKDCLSPFMRTKFFVNFLGEFLVRENIRKFVAILTCLDQGIYKKLVLEDEHTDFGMFVDEDLSVIAFKMHISLVQGIATEFDRTEAGDFETAPDDAGIESFDASGGNNKRSRGTKNSTEE